ncbi:MAG: hypothetical protein ACK5VZ_06615 [Alphaproteobacteria bacterium]|jgi:hypothetical protein
MELSAETYIAFSSAVVAVCALVVTIWQGRQNHKHNMLSVRPFLSTVEYNTEHGSIQQITFMLVNCGIGPAIIKNFVLLNGDEEVSRNNRKTYDDFVEQKCEGLTDVFRGSYVPGAVMQVGEKIVLLTFKYDMQKQNIDFVHKLNLLVDYQCIYQSNTFTYDSRNDRRFHGREAA